MTDTRRDLATLQATFADNESQKITPQNLRDFLYSMLLAHGSLMMVTPAATNVAVAGTYYKAAGTTSLASQTTHHLFDMPANNRLRYTGATGIHVHGALSVSMITSGANDVLGLAVAKNGTVLTHSIVRRFVSTGSDVGSTALHFDTPVSQDDYLELFVTNENAITTVTVTNMYMFALGMFM